MDNSLGSGGGGGIVSIRGTADARLSRGLLALLVLGLQGQSARTVLSLRGKNLAAAVGMRAGLTDSRINGLGNVLGVIQNQVRGHFRRAAAAASAAAAAAPAVETYGATSPLLPARVNLAGLQDAIPQTDLINNYAEAPPAASLSSSASSSTSTSTAGLDTSRSWGDDASSWYPLPGAENEVAMLLSGGVDSSVALRLLQDQGYKIRAFYLKIWLEDELAHLNECPWVSESALSSLISHSSCLSLCCEIGYSSAGAVLGGTMLICPLLRPSSVGWVFICLCPSLNSLDALGRCTRTRVGSLETQVYPLLGDFLLAASRTEGDLAVISGALYFQPTHEINQTTSPV